MIQKLLITLILGNMLLAPIHAAKDTSTHLDSYGSVDNGAENNSNDQEYKQLAEHATQPQAPYTLMTDSELIPLFTRPEEYQSILATPLAKEINPEVSISRHALMINKNNRTSHVNFDWYHNNKPEVIILALGKGATIKHKMPFIKEFTQKYDVIVFNYEWQTCSLIQRMARIPWPLQTYFEHNYYEVQEVVNFIREQAQHTSIVGHAECYSSFMFVKAQALRNKEKPLFDKLILDSGVLSINNVIKSLLKNPALCCNPLNGQAWGPVRAITGNKFFLTVAECCSRDYSIKEHLPKIDIPVLFVRGSKDTMVSDEDFKTMFALVPAPKAALITPYHHSDSFKRKNARKEYLHGEHLFIKNSFDDFVAQLTGR